MTAPLVFVWTASRYRLAKNIAEGDTYKVAGRKEQLAEATVKTYMREVPEFRAYVDKITIENELASRAGTLRLLLRVLPEKIEAAGTDKDSLLDYLKFIRELLDSEEKEDTELTVTWKKAGEKHGD